MTRLSILAAAMLGASCMLFFTANASAIDGEVLITQAKALAGNVTKGDAPGFPVTLSLPGSYKLASNLFPGPNENGIIAAASDITIDLNGFVMSGGPAGGTKNSLNGIIDLGDRLTVRNGTIGAFQTAGISAWNRAYLMIENMRIINGGAGIKNTYGAFTSVQNSVIATNRFTGIECGTFCSIEDNVVSGNGNIGVLIMSGTVLGNTIMANGSYGILGSNRAVDIVGVGNNTIGGNGNFQVSGNSMGFLHPNVCRPSSCL